MLADLARLVVRRRRAVIALWVLALVVVGALSASHAGEHRTDYAVPGSGSARAHELLSERFPDRAGDTIPLLFVAPGGVSTDDAVDLGRRHHPPQHRAARHDGREGPRRHRRGDHGHRRGG